MHDRMTGWFVVHTKRHRERLAQVRLAEAGVETYLPLLLQWPRPAVGSDVGPMFPSYVFAHATIPDDSHRICRTAGVHGFVTFGSLPAPIDPSVIAFFRAREGEDGVIRAEPFAAGREVQVVSGPFRGLVAVVAHRLGARQRVRVLLEILQRQTAVEMPERWVRQV
jgi:transcription antitermination factor NusG